MSEIENFQRRINAALDRIGERIEAAAPAAVDPAEMEEVKQALDDEKLANEQLQERVKALRAKRTELENALDAARDARTAEMTRLDAELQSLRRANQQLRDNNQALREANEAGVAEPHLINKSMLAELEGLRATQSADRAETEAVMAALAAAVATVSEAEPDNGDADMDKEDA